MPSNNDKYLSRRSFLISSLATAGTLLMPKLLRAAPVVEKTLKVYNTHTGEWFKGVYAIGNTYIPEALTDLQKLLRDWRINAQHEIDPQLYDMMHKLMQHFDTTKPFDLICGYRSPATNHSLRAHSKGVAQKSLHLAGKAVDISLNGVKLSALRDAAKSLKAGGVGYYPGSGFIHMDIRDKVAYW